MNINILKSITNINKEDIENNLMNTLFSVECGERYNIKKYTMRANDKYELFRKIYYINYDIKEMYNMIICKKYFKKSMEINLIYMRDNHEKFLLNDYIDFFYEYIKHREDHILIIRKLESIII